MQIEIYDVTRIIITPTMKYTSERLDYGREVIIYRRDSNGRDSKLVIAISCVDDAKKLFIKPIERG